MSSTNQGNLKKMRTTRNDESKSVEDDELAYCVLDIEGTGKSLIPNELDSQRDEVFAIGHCIFTMRSGVISTGRICLDLGKKPGENWDTLWSRRNFEERCYKEFWSKNEGVLDKLQDTEDPDNNMCMDRGEFDCAFKDFLLSMEQKFGKRWTILTDTTAYDTVGLNSMLVRRKFPPLSELCTFGLSAMLMRSGYHPLVNLQSNGGYHPRSTYDVDSAIVGRYGIAPGENPNDNPRYKKAREDFKKLETVPHDHMPDNDACNIASEFIYLWNHAPPLIDTFSSVE